MKVGIIPQPAVNPNLKGLELIDLILAKTKEKE